MNGYYDSLLSHYKKVWHNSALTYYPVNGRADDFDPQFCIAEFPPVPNRKMWTYATVGMGAKPKSAEIELHLFSGEQSGLHIELLVAVAHYHRTAAPLGMNHTVNFGRPWAVDSRCCFGFISLPYLDGQNLELFRHNNSTVHCLWLIPITESEKNFAKKNGSEELEAAFESKQFDYLDPSRVGVV